MRLCLTPKRPQPRGTETSRLRLGRQTHGVLFEAGTRLYVMSHGNSGSNRINFWLREVRVPSPDDGSHQQTQAETSSTSEHVEKTPDAENDYEDDRQDQADPHKPTHTVSSEKTFPPSPVRISRSEFYVATSWIARTRVARLVSESRARAASR